MNIAPFLKLMSDKNASDLYITPNAPIKIRIEGNLASVGMDALSPEQV
jgi:twitching motility protein PilU